MRTFSFALSEKDYRVYHPKQRLLEADMWLYQRALEVFPRLLSSDRLPFSPRPDVRHSFPDSRFARYFVALADAYRMLEQIGFNPAPRVTTSILYEYHPHIEVLLEFLLRREGHTIFGVRADASASRALQPCRRIAQQDLPVGRPSDSIFSLSACAIRVLAPLHALAMPNITRPPDTTEMQSIQYARQLVHGLKAFFGSKEVKEYLVLREKTYSNVFDKTVQYGVSIVERYDHCFMVMTELLFPGEDWDDAAIRDCAHRVGGLFKQLVPAVKQRGVLGHAWRLDTIRDRYTQSSPLINVWRVRWLTFVQQGPTGPAMTGEEIAASLHAEAEKLLEGISPSPSLASAVIKDMTPLSVEPPPVSGSSEDIKDYRQLIEDWVFELSMVEIYRRIRVMEGSRPMMCGRGHPSDGRVKRGE